MIFDNLEFFNVAEIQETKLGYRMFRFPKAVCDNMGEGKNQYGRYVSQTTTGCEIRFVLDGDRAIISLTSIDEDGYVYVYRGDFAYYTNYLYAYPVKKGQITHISLKKEPNFENFPQEYKQGAFSPDVWRIVSDINFTMVYVGIETYGNALRPPLPSEVPAKTLLCYGTSLTYGACAHTHSISYIQILGRLLECNILNKAMGGSCMNEKGVTDYFVSGKEKFDAILLENAVNMAEMPQAYKTNCEYLIDNIAKAYPNYPIYCLTCYPNFTNITGETANPCKKKLGENANIKCDSILRDITRKYPNCHLLEGGELMDHATDLTCDLIHMSDYGHIRTAVNLSKLMQI